MLTRFWDRWKKEYLIKLSENRKVKLQKFNSSQIPLKDVVLAEDERQFRLIWRVGIAEELLQGKMFKFQMLQGEFHFKETCE